MFTFFISIFIYLARLRIFISQHQSPLKKGVMAKAKADDDKETLQERLERLANSVESGNSGPAVVAELREIAKEVK